MMLVGSTPLCAKGVAECGSRTNGGRGVWPKAEKKKVTLLILTVEVISRRILDVQLQVKNNKV